MTKWLVITVLLDGSEILWPSPASVQFGAVMKPLMRSLTSMVANSPFHLHFRKQQVLEWQHHSSLIIVIKETFSAHIHTQLKWRFGKEWMHFLFRSLVLLIHSHITSLVLYTMPRILNIMQCSTGHFLTKAIQGHQQTKTFTKLNTEFFQNESRRQSNPAA